MRVMNLYRFKQNSSGTVANTRWETKRDSLNWSLMRDASRETYSQRLIRTKVSVVSSNKISKMFRVLICGIHYNIIVSDIFLKNIQRGE